MSRMFEFDTRKAIVAAWEHIWKKQRAEIANGTGWRGQSYYTTAQDMERVVRGFADETLDGKPWGSEDRYYGGFNRAKFRGPIPLNDQIRTWLLTEARSGRIASHNFGKGHISGMRFRPKDIPLYEAERKTIEKHAIPYNERKPKPVHFSVTYGGALFCTVKPRSSYRSHRGTGRATPDPTKITCPRCLKLGAVEKAPALLAEHKAKEAENEARWAKVLADEAST